MNVVILSGRLTADVETRYLPSGAAVGQFNLAVSRKYKQGEEWKEEVSFIGIQTFGKQAETVAQYLKKGSPILIHGRVKQDSWEKDGRKHSKTLVVMEAFEFMSAKGESSGGGTQTEFAKPPAARPSSPTPSTSPPDEDDVPFAHHPRRFNPMRYA